MLVMSFAKNIMMIDHTTQTVMLIWLLAKLHSVNVGFTNNRK